MGKRVVITDMGRRYLAMEGAIDEALDILRDALGSVRMESKVEAAMRVLRQARDVPAESSPAADPRAGEGEDGDPDQGVPGVPYAAMRRIVDGNRRALGMPPQDAGKAP